MSVLALPRIAATVPPAIVSLPQVQASAGLVRFLIEAGALANADVPDAWSDALDVCQRALEGWVRQQIGPLRCLTPTFVLAANQGDAWEGGQRPAYASVTLSWMERQERQWAVGPGLDALERARRGLGAAVLEVLQRHGKAYPLFTPAMACDVASYLYWHGEDSEEGTLEMTCGDDEAAREEMRTQMVTRRTLELAYPAWAWTRPRNRRGPSLRTLARGLDDARLCAIVGDALALSRARVANPPRPDIEGDDIAWGAVLTWREDDVTTRIYDDLLEVACEGEFCDRIGEVELPLDRPERFAQWRTGMRAHFRSIALIDGLIHALADGDWG